MNTVNAISYLLFFAAFFIAELVYCNFALKMLWKITKNKKAVNALYFAIIIPSCLVAFYFANNYFHSL